jgi:enoyl-CoA hydratase/carnithine racemase
VTLPGIRIERDGDLAVLRFDKARGNAIDEPFTEALHAAIAQVASDASVRSVLLASAHPKVFCPGLDLVALIEYDRPAMQRFFARFLETTRALFALRKPVVAALSGHAVAGGLVIALTADHRVLRRGAQVGLNEVRVGIPLPWSVAMLLKAAVPASALTRVALLGQNFTDDEAVAVGLVHEVQDAEGFEEACRTRLRELAEKDPRALGATKAYLRDAALREMEAKDVALLPEFLDAWFSPEAQAKIRETIDMIARRT